MPVGRDWPIEAAKSLASSFDALAAAFAAYMKSTFGVILPWTRSLVEGWEQIGAAFTLNSFKPAEMRDSVVVLAVACTLRAEYPPKACRQDPPAFSLAEHSRVPVRPRLLISSQEGDVCIVPSDWVLDLYESRLSRPEGTDRRVACGRRYIGHGLRIARERSGGSSSSTRNSGRVPSIQSILTSIISNSRGFEVKIINAGHTPQTEYLEALRRGIAHGGVLSWTRARSCVGGGLVLRRSDFTVEKTRSIPTRPSPMLAPRPISQRR